MALRLWSYISIEWYIFYSPKKLNSHLWATLESNSQCVWVSASLLLPSFIYNRCSFFLQFHDDRHLSCCDTKLTHSLNVSFMRMKNVLRQFHLKQFKFYATQFCTVKKLTRMGYNISIWSGQTEAFCWEKKCPNCRQMILVFPLRWIAVDVLFLAKLDHLKWNRSNVCVCVCVCLCMFASLSFFQFSCLFKLAISICVWCHSQDWSIMLAFINCYCYHLFYFSLLFDISI